MSLFRRKPKRFIAARTNHGFKFLDPWAVYLNERDHHGYKPVPSSFERVYPDLRIGYLMSKSQAKSVARFLNKNHPLTPDHKSGRL